MPVNHTDIFEDAQNQQIFAIDNMEYIRKLDKDNMFQIVYELPEQMEEALNLAENMRLNRFENELSYVIISGVGGSAIAGDLIRVLLSNVCKVPILVNRDYSVPGYVNQNTLVIASSYSGETEETLSSYREAKGKSARIIAVTTGGTLGKMALEDNNGLIIMPGGLSPRAAIGYSLIFLLSVFTKLGLINDMTSEISTSISHLKKLRDRLKPEASTQYNQAKQIAQKLVGKLPIIYGSSGTTEVIAQRWKAQICENAKTIAYNNTFPELNHNEIVGSEYPTDIVGKMLVILLKDKEDFLRNKLRMNITSEILSGKVSEIVEVNSEGDNALERMLSLVFIGDYVSLYLSVANGKDPTPIERIIALKDKLARH